MKHLFERPRAFRRRLALSCRLGCTLLIAAAAPLGATAMASAEVERAERLAAFALPPSVRPLPTELRSAEGLPRAAFAQGEEVVLGVRSPEAARVFAVLIDSHGLVSLLGDEGDGWIGNVNAKSDTPLPLLGEAQWSNGLPLGDARVVVLAFARPAADEVTQGLTRIPRQEGIVGHAAIPALADFITTRASAPSGALAAAQVDVSLIHAKAPRSRGLGLNSGAPTRLPRLVEREEIVRHFTGPRSRGIQRLRLDVYIPFAFNARELAPGRNRQLEEMAAAMKDAKLRDSAFLVGGHTDRVGGHEYNLELSRDRARFIRDRLVAEYGIRKERLTARGFAFDRALDRSESPDADATNRRVDFQILRDDE